jgi:hypothetical protein
MFVKVWSFKGSRFKVQRFKGSEVQDSEVNVDPESGTNQFR